MDEKNYKFGPRKKALSLSVTPFVNKGLVEPILVYLFIYFFPQADILVSELLGSFGDNELSPECLDGAQRFLKGQLLQSYIVNGLNFFVSVVVVRGEGRDSETNATQDGGSFLSALKHIFKQVTAGTTIINHSSHQNFHILEKFLICPGIKYEPTLTPRPDFHFSRSTPIFRASTRIRDADHNSSS